jgi:2-polyprenyl-6-methoxyphenol hydroxylase-like FAD-dependent oxidoreductase
MKITIIGAGIGGLTSAIALKKIGIETTLFESAPELKPVGAGLGLSSNAMAAFEWLNLSEEIKSHGRFLQFFSIYDQNGKIISRFNYEKGQSKFQNFTIHRGLLHKQLLSKLDVSQIHLNKRVVDVVQTEKSVIVSFQDGSTHQADLLLAADGVNSIIRNKILPETNLRYAGYTCWRAVVDNTEMNLDETSESWGAAGRFGIVPLSNKKLYWFACVNAKQNDPKMKAVGIEDLMQRFKNYHHPIPTVCAKSKDNQLIWNDIYDIEPLDRFAFERILLLGDAAHATTPNMGQGACQAIEDAVVLAQCFSKNSDYKNVFSEFEGRRIGRTKWITETSRRIGSLAQLESSLPIMIRNFALRLIPPRVTEKQMYRLSSVDFK